MSERFKSFEEFWPYYVGEHRKPLCRALHYMGTGMALSLAASAVVTLNPIPLALAPVAGYGPAWFSHFFIEHNRPATFTYPSWSLRADFKMLGLALRGRMAAEVTRLYGSPNPASDAPCLSST